MNQNADIKKLIAIISLVFFIQIHANSQKQGKDKIDSLYSVFQLDRIDTNKLSALHLLVREYRYTNHDSALHYGQVELALANKVKDDLRIADAKLALGGLYADIGKSQQGASSAGEALLIYQKLMESPGDYSRQKIKRKIASSYGIIGHNKIAEGNYPEGLRNTFLALKIVEELGDKDGISAYEWNIGNIYVTQHNYEEALKHYTVCLPISIRSGDKNNIADTYGAIGFVYIQQGRYKEAMENYSTALKLAEVDKDPYTLAEIYVNLGEIYGHLGHYNEALKYDFAALKSYLEVGIVQQASLACLQIGLAYTNLKNSAAAYTYLEKGLSMAIKCNNMEYIKLSYENYTKLDSSTGNYKKALEHYKLSIQYRDSLMNNENTKKLVQSQMQYDFDKKESLTKAEQEKKDAVALKELQKQKLVRNGFVGGFAVVLLFAGVFFTQRNKIKTGKKRSDELLLNILPEEVAEELKAKGSADARQFDQVTVMFTDFKNFTQISEKLSPAELVAEIDACFKAFDEIISKHNIEKIKTIGDSYMCAGGLPVANKTHAADVVNAALEICEFIQHHKPLSGESLGIRLGIHSGPVVAGIVGVKKFAYDIWGDTVNIASRMESSGEAGKVNISGSTYELVKGKFSCKHRGKIQAKNKGEIDMYFVEHPI